MADKNFGVKQINLIGASGTPTIESPNNININAVNVAISTDMSVGGSVGISSNLTVSGILTATSFSGDGSALTGVSAETLDVFVRTKDTGNIVGRSGNIALRPVAITVTSNTIDIVPRSGSDITVTV